MKKSLLLLSILILICSTGFSQTNFQQIYSNDTLGIDIINVVQTGDGGFIMAGTVAKFILFGFGPGDVFLLRTDSAGDMIWWRRWDLLNDEQVFSMAKTDDDTYIICGFTFGATTNSRDGFMLKADDSGNLLWAQRYDHVAASNTFHSIQPANQNQLILSGRSEGGTGGTYDTYLALSDTAGTIQWAHTYGGPNSDWGWWAEQTNDGGFIMTGETQSFGFGSNDIYLIKTDGIGDKIWSRNYGGTDFEKGLWVSQSNEGYYVAGYTQGFVTGNTEAKTFLMRIDLSGNVDWFKIYQEMTTPSAAYVTPDGGCMLIGDYHDPSYTQNDMGVIKTDSSGNVQWARRYGTTSTDVGTSVAQLSNGFAFAGITYHPSSSIYKAYLVKTDLQANSACNDSSFSVTVYTASPFAVPPPDMGSSGTDAYLPSVISTVPPVVQALLCDSSVITHAINNIPEEFFSVSPNPAGDVLHIQLPESQTGTLQLIDFTGRIMYSKELSNTAQEDVNVSHLADGIYLLSISAKDWSEVRKVVIAD